MPVSRTATKTTISAEPGSGGLFYLPYLSGERSPFLAPEARGAFIGLTTRSSKSEMARAVLEGVSYSLKSIAETLFKGDSPKSGLVLSGGGAGNELWARIISSVLNSKVTVLAEASESGVLGNAIIAEKALGFRDSFDAPQEFITTSAEFKPVPGEVEYYQRGFEVFRKLFPALSNSFSEISSLK